MDDGTTCVICQRGLREPELGRFACCLCQRRGTERLRDLPTLYAQTAHLLLPGVRGRAGRVTSSKSAPLPCSEAVLNLRARGGLVTILESWESAFRDDLGFAPAPFRGNFEQSLAGAVGWLINAAPWAYSSFAAVDEYHREILQLHGQIKAQVSGEPPARRVTVTCTCGATMRITLDTPGRRCTCGQQYGWAELRQLPLAERTAA